MTLLNRFFVSLVFTLFFGGMSASAKNCPKIYNDCRNQLFSNKKDCTKKREKCEAENEKAQIAVTQSDTKNRMLNGDGSSGDSIQAKKEAAKKRLLQRQQEHAQSGEIQSN